MQVLKLHDQVSKLAIEDICGGIAKKYDFVHNLNSSGLDTNWLFAGMVEQNQLADGSVVVPQVLRKWVGKN